MAQKEYDDFKKAACRNCGERQRDLVVEIKDESWCMTYACRIVLRELRGVRTARPKMAQSEQIV